MWHLTLHPAVWVKTLLLLLVEAGIIFSAVILGLWLRYEEDYTRILFAQRGIYKIAMTTMVSQFIFYLYSLYDISKPRIRRELLLDLFQAVSTVLVVLGIVFVLRPTLLIGYEEVIPGGAKIRFGNRVPLLAMVTALTLMMLWRLAIHWLLRHPKLGERLVIIGTDRLASDVASEAMARADLGYKVVGFVAEREPSTVVRELPVPVLGTVATLDQLVREYRIDRVVVALEDRRGHLPVDQLLRIRLEGKAFIEEGTSLYERLTGRINVRMLRPSWLIFSGGGRRTNFWHTLRRLFNIGLALVGLLLTWPVMILVAIAIKLDSRGPVFYSQERVGQHDEIFRMHKFRSMVIDAEEGSGPQWAQSRDPRITRVGRFLRKTRLDELPQFLNVLRGEMSFVGPRAERPYFVDQLNQQIPFYSQRHLVEPGLTGWAQVNYGYGASVEDAIEKLQYDLYYIKNVSLFFDIWILFKSIRIVLFGYGR
jgi:sugar transferase (PEP-CTERM system associated)